MRRRRPGFVFHLLALKDDTLSLSSTSIEGVKLSLASVVRRHVGRRPS